MPSNQSPQKSSWRYRVYLDACCVCRPFDDDTEDRIRLEAEAVYLVLRHVRERKWWWIGSEVLEDELCAIPDTEKREQVEALLEAVAEAVKLTQHVLLRGQAIERMGFKGQDALHLACAELGSVDVFLTTDDQLLKKASRNRRKLSVRVQNPVDWIREASA